MTPIDDLERLRDVWHAIPPPSPAVRQRARARLLAEIERSTHASTSIRGRPRRPHHRAARAGWRLGPVTVAALAVALLATGLSWWVVQSTATGPAPVIDRGEPDVVVPSAPLEVRTEEAAVVDDPALDGARVHTVVYRPEAPGPWPLVVLLPGWWTTTDSVEDLARSIAQRGSVVQLTWTGYEAESLREGISFTPEILEEKTLVAACAVRHARAMVDDRGAEVGRLVVAGQGLGFWLAGRVALMQLDLPARSCTARTTSSVPDDVVGIAGEFLCTLSRDAECPNPFDDEQPLTRNRHVSFTLMVPSHSTWTSPEPELALAEQLRAGGRPVDTIVLDDTSPGDFLVDGSPAFEAAVETILEVARG